MEEDTREGKIQKKLPPPLQDKTDHVSQLLPDSPAITTSTTRSGHAIKKPARFRQVFCPECLALKEGGSVGYGETRLRTGDSCKFHRVGLNFL